MKAWGGEKFSGYWSATYVQPEIAPPGHGDQVATPQVRHLMRYRVCHHEVPAAVKAGISVIVYMPAGLIAAAGCHTLSLRVQSVSRTT